MKAKTSMRISSAEDFNLENCRKTLAKSGALYSDEEIIMLRNFLFVMARIYYDFSHRVFNQKIKENSTNDIYHLKGIINCNKMI